MKFDHPWLALLCFVLCIPSAGSLLTKVYGIMPLREGVLYIAIPASLIVVAIYFYTRKKGPQKFADLLLVGAFAGLIGTFAYDISRVPFHIFGQRIFAPISAYGLWILDSAKSSRFTEVTGWAYHFWNGIAFGIMYTIVMRGRSWAWAVVWGCVLETIAFVSPFGRIFSIWGNWQAIGVAYLGHVAYGIPLGLLVQRFDATLDWLKSIPKPMAAGFFGFCLLALCSPLLDSNQAAADERAQPHRFIVEGNRLNPGWVRISRGQSIALSNESDKDLRIQVLMQEQNLRSREQKVITFDKAGVFPIAVLGPRRLRYSFIVVEPVEKQ